MPNSVLKCKLGPRKYTPHTFTRFIAFETLELIFQAAKSFFRLKLGTKNSTGISFPPNYKY